MTDAISLPSLRTCRRRSLCDLVFAAAILLAVAGCATQENRRAEEAAPIFEETGVASWYGAKHHGARTASGARFDMRKRTAAHRSLPLDTVARVTNLENGRTVTVTINDRGPFIKGRIIDLSAKAAQLLDMKEDGLARVRIEVFAADQPAPPAIATK